MIVKAFFSILQSISATDTSFITNVCDDTLGGIPSIDARKFGAEYARRRLEDEKSVDRPAEKSASRSSLVDSSFTVVTKKKSKKGSGRE